MRNGKIVLSLFIVLTFGGAGSSAVEVESGHQTATSTLTLTPTQ